MPAPPTSTFAIRRSFDESEEMAQFLGGWDLDLMQLDAGCFRGEHLIAGHGPVIVQEGRSAPSLVQRGQTPGQPTFCLLGNAGSRMSVNGRDMSGDQVLLVRPWEEIHVHTEPRFHVFTVTVAEDYLRSVARRLDLERAVDQHAGKQFTRPAKDLTAGLRRRLLGWSKAMAMFGDDPPEEQRQHLDLAVVRAIIGTLATEAGDESCDIHHALDRVVRSVEAAIARRPRHAYRVDELAMAVGTSERSLRRAIQAWYGVSPKRLIRTRRLHGARAALQGNGHDRARVTDTALDWGFTHLGRFSTDYKHLFGERPSETLAAAGGKSRVFVEDTRES